MGQDHPEISIVIPLFNEEPNLRELHSRITEVMSGLGLSYEIVFVDDGSYDRSFEVIEELYRGDDHIRAFKLRRNCGKSAALAVGFSEARGDVVITMDADLQDDPDEIPNFLKKLDEGYDLVSGWKFKRKDPPSKTIPSKIFNRVTSLMTGVKIHDINCGFKAYRREVTEEIRVYGELHRYLPVLAHWRGYRVGEIKVRHHPRFRGKSKFGIGRFLHGFFDLFTVLLLTRYIARPLHFFGGIGLLFAFTGFCINSYLAYLRFRYGSIMGRHPLLQLGILLMVLGVQLFSTGLIAELVSGTRGGVTEYPIGRRLTGR